MISVAASEIRAVLFWRPAAVLVFGATAPLAYLAVADPAHTSLFVAEAWLVFILGVVLAIAPPPAVIAPLSLVIGALLLSYIGRPLQLVYDRGFVTFAEGYDPVLLPVAVWYALLMAVSLAAGYTLTVGGRIAAAVPPPPEVDVFSSRVRHGISVLCVITTISYVGLVRASGLGWGQAFLNPVVFRANTSAGGTFYLGGLVLWAMWTTFYIVMLRAMRTTAAMRGMVLRVVVVFGAAAALTVPFGSRGFLLIPVLAGLAVWDIRRPGRITFVHATMLALAMMVFAGAYAAFREAQGLGGTSRAVSTVNDFDVIGAASKGVARFDSVDFFTWVLREYGADGRDFLYGRTLLDFAVQPVPRTIFPAKASQTSAYLMEVLKPSYDRSFTPEFGLVSELYVNGWIVAIIVGGVAFGIVLRALEMYFVKYRDRDSAMLLYPAFLTAPMGWLLAGFNSFATILLVLNACLTLIFIAVFRRRSLR